MNIFPAECTITVRVVLLNCETARKWQIVISKQKKTLPLAVRSVIQ